MKKYLGLGAIAICIIALIFGFSAVITSLKEYKVGATTETQGAVITGSGYYKMGQEVELFAGEVDGCDFRYWVLNDTAVSNSNPYKFKLTKETKGLYTAVYAKPYLITIGQFSNGVVNVADTEVFENDEIIVSVQSAEHYELKSLSYTLDEQQIEIHKFNGEYRFYMPPADIVINAEFAKKQNNIEYEYDDQVAQVSTSAEEDKAYFGQKIQVFISIEEGYELEILKYVINDEEHEINYSEEDGYYFIMPSDDIKIVALFKEKI